MKRVLLVSPHRLFSTGLESLLCRQGELEIVGPDTTPETAFERIKALRPDVVIAVNDPPACDPAAIAGRIFREGIPAKVIEVSLCDKKMYIYHGEQLTTRGVADLLQAIGERQAEAGPATRDDFSAQAHFRTQIYGFLAAVFNRLPNEQFAAGLSSSAVAGLVAYLAEGQDLPAEMQQGLALIEQFIHAVKGMPLDALKRELVAERARLVWGPGAEISLRPPYESKYRRQEGSPPAGAGAEIAGIYAAAEIRLPEEVREQPDYIGLELDFMRQLTEREARGWTRNDRGEVARTLEMERAFLTEHLVCWVPLFCDAMLAHARLDFYRGIARMTKGFVIGEAQKISAVVEQAGAVQASGSLSF